MIDGFWIVQYEGIAGNGGGVAVFLHGKVYGGDTGYLYQGEVQQTGQNVVARIRVTNFLPEIMSVLGTNDNFELLVNGQLDSETILGNASVFGHDLMGIVIRMTKVSEIKS